MATQAARPASPAPPRSRPGRPRRDGLVRAAPARVAGLLVLLGVLVVVALLGVAVGARPIPVGTVLDALTAYDPASDEHLIVQTLRIPRTVLGIAV
ncbi:MAG: Fe(3+)-siderophore ABC transporter permease, partial [Kineosporiaceae bacterium]